MRWALALLLLAATSAAEVCTGKSSQLPPTQCNAYVDFFDDAGGPDWFLCERSREDPCSCEGGPVTCNKEGTAITGLDFKDLNLVGSLPASMSALVDLTSVDFDGNHLTGPLPALPWSKFENKYACVLMGSSKGSRTNVFDCPLPDGSLAVPCQKVGPKGLSPILSTDCGPAPAPTPPAPKQLYSCVNNTCVPKDAGVPMHKCKAACG